MGMYDNFSTDKQLEVEGVWTNYGDFRVKIAHTGGANKQYLTQGEMRMKPYRRAIDSGNFPRERMESLLFELYADTIIKDWETNVGEPGEEKWERGIENPDGGELLPVNRDNILLTLRNLPALFYDIKEVADSIAAYRQMDLRAESGNS